MRPVSPRAILLGAWLVVLLYAYPGYLPAGAADQLVDARVGQFTDWHSPGMTEVWRIVERVMAGPAGMLLLQSGLFLVGAFTLLRRMLTDRAAALATAGLVLFPPVLASVAVLSPEILFVSFAVAGLGAVTSPDQRMRVVGWALVATACMVGHATAIAMFVLVIGMYRGVPTATRWARAVAPVGVAAVVVAAGIGLSHVLVDTKTQRSESVRAMGDIVGTLSFSDRIDDATLLATHNVTFALEAGLQDHARAGYRTSSNFATSWKGLFAWPETREQRAGVFALRDGLVRANPKAYLRHRGLQLYRALGLPPGRRWSPVYSRFVHDIGTAEAIQHMARYSLVQKQLVRGVRAISTTFLFRPYFYALLAIALLVTAIIRRNRLAIVLLASAAGYVASQLFLVTRYEYRDWHWLVVATVLAGIALVAERRVLWCRPRVAPAHLDRHAVVQPGAVHPPDDQ